jgi:hypothetical protein
MIIYVRGDDFFIFIDVYKKSLKSSSTLTISLMTCKKYLFLIYDM